MNKYLKNLEVIKANPNLIIAQVLDDMEAQLEGNGSYDIPDGTHPFVHAIENGVLMAVYAMNEAKSITHRLYPSNAITVDDLYLHMSDDDYLNRFANPALTHFEFLLNYEEVIARMQPVGDTGIRKIVIPRLTEVEVADYHFTMQYPIEIRQMRHGGIQVVYDLDKPSPIQTMDTNQVEHKVLVIDRKRYLWIRTPMYQMRLQSYVESLNPTVPFEGNYSFDNQFFHARAYISTDSGWQEIHTTHSEQVFSPTELTLVLKVVNGKLHAEFPLIYTTTQMAKGELRLDLYTTLGVVDVDLGSYTDTNFKVNFNSLDDNTTFTDPINHIGEAVVMNPSRVRGGSNAMSISTLRDNVIDGVIGSNKLPITDVQLESYLTRRGYDLVSIVDNLTDRQFLASRRLPPASNQTVTSAAGTMMGQVQVTLEQLAPSQHVADNGVRVTILPSMLYSLVNGVVMPLPDSRIQTLVNSHPEALTRLVGDSRYIYTPFHYVLDTTQANFDVRPYYFGKPYIVRKTFVGDNDSSQILANIGSFNIERIEHGFRITVKLVSDSQFKQVSDDAVVVQLGYRPLGENNYASVNGVLLGKEDNERLYQFDILTNWDIDAEDGLYTTNMSMYDLGQTRFSLGMLHDVDLTICIDGQQSPGYVSNEIDAMVQDHLMSSRFMVLTRERLTVQFGYELKDLWRRNRTVIGPESYRTYTQDVPAVYAENVYERDANGRVIINKLPDGSLEYKILHRAGDPILDAAGKPVLQHRKGDVVLDSSGNPTLIEGRRILREFTLFLIDGLYYFANEDSSKRYSEEIPMQVVEWVRGDIANIRKQLLERARIYFCPITTFGNTTATVKEGLLSDIELDQAITVTYYMDPSNYSNTALRPALVQTTKQVINEQLQSTQIVRSEIIAALRLALGDIVSGIEVTGLGGVNDFGIITLEDDSVRLSLRKRLTVLTNQELMVEDDLNINFLRH